MVHNNRYKRRADGGQRETDRLPQQPDMMPEERGEWRMFWMGMGFLVLFGLLLIALP